MSVPVRVLDLSIEEYLSSEELSKVRREYVNGQIFAMVGATEAHNVICANLLAAIHAHLQGSSCRVFMADMKVKVEASKSFYYPDIMVTCEPFEAKSVFKQAPVLIIEVASPSTKEIDKREKLVAYRTLPSLQEYLIVYQNQKLVEVYYKDAHTKDAHGQWEMKIVRLNESICLQSLPNSALQINLGSVYVGL